MLRILGPLTLLVVLLAGGWWWNRVSPPAWLAGTVVDDAGRPVADAQVVPGVLHDTPSGDVAFLEFPDASWEASWSNARGRYRIPQPTHRALGRPAVEVVHRHHLRVRHRVRPGTRDQVLVIPRAAILRVRLRQDVAPAGAFARFPLPFVVQTEDGTTHLPETLEDGRAEFSRLPSGRVLLHVRDAAYRPLGPPRELTLTPGTPGAPTEIEIDLRGKLVRARLTASDAHGTVAPGALRVYPCSEGSLMQSVESRGPRDFLIAPEPVDVWTVHFRTDQWARFALRAGSNHVVLRDPVTLRLALGGQPASLADKRVRLGLADPSATRFGGGWMHHPANGVADADGVFTFTVPWLPEYRVDAWVSPAAGQLPVRAGRVTGVATVAPGARPGAIIPVDLAGAALEAKAAAVDRARSADQATRAVRIPR